MRISRATVVLICLLTALPTTTSSAQTEVPNYNGKCHEIAKGYKCLYGPFSYEDTPIDPRTGERTGTLVWTGLVRPPDAAGYITSMRATLEDREGEFVPRHAVHLHHAVWLNTSKADMTCEEFPIIGDYLGYTPDRFFATGKERTKIGLPDGYGYHWDNEGPSAVPFLGPTWAMNTHLHWMHGDEPKEVYIRFNLQFTPEEEADGMTDVRPVWFDIDNCSDSEFDVPVPGVGYSPTWDYTMPLGGRFITLGGHLHDGGRRLKLENLTRKKTVYVSRARYRGDDPAMSGWDLRSMSAYSRSAGIRVAAGDKMRLTAVYSDARKWHGVMGIMIGALVVEP